MQKKELQKIATTSSPNQLALKRFKRNKPAVIGSCFIIFCILLAIFAYQIVPDGSPNANRQIPELNLSEAGLSTKLLRVQNNFARPKKNFIKRFFMGKEDVHTYIPLEDIKINNDTIQTFLNGKAYKAYHLADVVYSINNPNEIKSGGDKYLFTSLDGQQVSVSKADIEKTVSEKHIRKTTFWLGTDQYGRDVLSRLIIGVRISLLAGLIAVIISILLGTLLGMLAGYYGGRIDTVISFFINTVWSIPTLLLVFAIVIALGKSITNIFLAVGLTMWVDVARIVRGQVLLSLIHI